MSRLNELKQDEDAIRMIAQRDPTPNMVASFGDFQLQARNEVLQLVGTLRRIDEIAAELAERNITVSVDLGPIGNAAAAARRDLEKQKPPQFTLPHRQVV